MLIILNFPKTIASATRRPRGPCLWDLCCNQYSLHSSDRQVLYWRFFGFNNRLEFRLIIWEYIFSESKTKWHRSKILSVIQKEAKARQKRPKEKEKSALDKYFTRLTSENAQEALEEPSHSDDGDNAGSQPMDVPRGGAKRAWPPEIGPKNQNFQENIKSEA